MPQVTRGLSEDGITLCPISSWVPPTSGVPRPSSAGPRRRKERRGTMPPMPANTERTSTGAEGVTGSIQPNPIVHELLQAPSSELLQLPSSSIQAPISMSGLRRGSISKASTVSGLAILLAIMGGGSHLSLSTPSRPAQGARYESLQARYNLVAWWGVMTRVSVGGAGVARLHSTLHVPSRPSIA